MFARTPGLKTPPQAESSRVSKGGTIPIFRLIVFSEQQRGESGSGFVCSFANSGEEASGQVAGDNQQCLLLIWHNLNVY